MGTAEAGPRWAIVVHGGAGVIERQQLTAEQERAYREAMRKVTDSGTKLLAAGKPALDVISKQVAGAEQAARYQERRSGAGSRP